jgi:ATP-dependent DNA helicase DinG
LHLPHLDLPALALTGAGGVLARSTGETETVTTDDARHLLAGGDVLICHAIFASQRLQARLAKPLFDVLELFAFVKPGEPCLPSPLGLARALRLRTPHTAEDMARILHKATAALFDALAGLSPDDKERARKTAAFMAKAGWRWGPALLAVLGEPERMTSPLAGIDAWRRLAEWEDAPPPAHAGSASVETGEAQARLTQLIGRTGALRPLQQDFAAAATAAFGPRLRPGAPRIALVEAGTGTGKTLGYLAPASLWAEKNGPGLWISTYTRNLQRQIQQESEKLARGTPGRALNVVIRKGRENYLCLLNFEDAAKRNAMAQGQRAVALGLIARWLAVTPDGDISGAGFPAFLAGAVPLRELTDRRGECIYAACPHYRVCFIERGLRRAHAADIVIANHALVMAQASRDGLRAEEADDVEPERRVRYVFDEGHHLFDASDSAFSADLSGAEMAELRRWIRGPEGRPSRARGLNERVRDLLAGEDAVSALEEALAAASALAGEGWLARMRGGIPRGSGETFLAHVYTHVRARSADGAGEYGLEAEVRPLEPALLEAAQKLDHWLVRLGTPMGRLAQHLHKRLDAEAANLDTGLRVRIEAALRGLERRTRLVIPAWRAMLAALEAGPGPTSEFADWFEIARAGGRDFDVGLKRHWIDPTIPFAETILKPAHGALITSATLRDAGNTHGNENPDQGDWRSAEVRVGAHHLPEPPVRALFGSPFDWASQSRIIVVRDIDRRDWDQLGAAYRELFLASGGGALGLFTAVKTLRAVHARIAAPLADGGLSLYAQHLDALDTGTLVDLFRAEENACLLGTDALRDGVDVPGRSLRLCVFDKVPWPKPTILHKARRARFGKTYDDLLARLRLKQAFGRLIRNETDRGVFVILDAACPSRLLAALPPEAPVIRCGFAEALAETRNFLVNARAEVEA